MHNRDEVDNRVQPVAGKLFCRQQDLSQVMHDGDGSLHLVVGEWPFGGWVELVPRNKLLAEGQSADEMVSKALIKHLYMMHMREDSLECAMKFAHAVLEQAMTARLSPRTT